VRYHNGPSRFPLITNVLKSRSEPREKFDVRLIKWAINRLADEDRQVTLTNLIHAGVLSKIVKKNINIVIVLARQRKLSVAGLYFEQVLSLPVP
jgi:hypothetical protein